MICYTFVKMIFNDTIVALATPTGIGAIGVIRVSGTSTFEIIEKLLHNSIKDKKSHSIVLRELYDNEGIIDEALISVFRGSRSYTGEDTVEISIHGSDYIATRLIKALLYHGARMAEPGEFTQRAFLNGKLDLAQAEAVADVIASEHQFAHEQAMNQLRGGYSKDIELLREKLLDFTSLIELELDFGEEDVEFASRSELSNLVTEIKNRVDRLSDSFTLGNALKKGFTVVLAGRPNAGKSTMFNALLNEDRAIVSDIEGTTRDSIEELIQVGGIRMRVVDTAGIRDATDVIEKEGINRTFKHVEASGITLYLFDPSVISPDDVKSDLDKLKDKTARVWTIANKMDLFSGDLNSFGVVNAKVTAKDSGSVIELFEKIVQELTAEISNLGNEIVVTNARHAESFRLCSTELQSILDGINNSLTGDLLSFHLRSGIKALASITGEIDNEEVLGNIFSKFCIGK